MVSLPTYKCCLLTTFANSLDPGQARQNVRLDLDPNCLTLISLKEFFENADFEKYQMTQNYPARKDLTGLKLNA